MKKIDITHLSPTQFVLGMKEVNAKIAKMSKMSESELKAYCEDHHIPVVKGPGESVYMIDHHHFARACWELDVEDYKLDLVLDLSHLEEKEFWTEMKKRKWTYLMDQFGNGPHSPELLPVSVRSMGDDPLRSLVWMLVDGGVIEKSKVPFFEFHWAEFFRANLGMSLRSKSDFKEAYKKAAELARTDKTSNLDGWVKS
jgi:hypothetical protein